MSSFALDISKFAKKAEGNLDTVVRKTTLEVFKRVIMRSPVDTGRFRANWIFSQGAPSSNINTSSFDKSGSATVGKVDSALPEKAAGGVYCLTNNLPYANRLEDGYSGQAPQGMVQLTVIEFEGIARANVK